MKLSIVYVAHYDPPLHTPTAHAATNHTIPFSNLCLLHCGELQVASTHINIHGPTSVDILTLYLLTNRFSFNALLRLVSIALFLPETRKFTLHPALQPSISFSLSLCWKTPAFACSSERKNCEKAFLTQSVVG